MGQRKGYREITDHLDRAEMERKLDIVQGTIEDAVSDLLYYDRKEDEDLGRGEIEALIYGGHLSVDQVVEWFRKGLEQHIQGQ